MIRVIYRWRVRLGDEKIFRNAWEAGTAAIQRAFQGSHGSMLLQCKNDPSEFAAIAAWDDVFAWKSARRSPQWPPDPEAARAVHSAAGKTISMQIFEEVSDLTTIHGRWTPGREPRGDGQPNTDHTKRAL